MAIDKITDSESIGFIFLKGKSQVGELPLWLTATDEPEVDFEKQIYEGILAKVRAGVDVDEAYDDVFGAGAYARLAAESYEQMIKDDLAKIS